LFVYYFTYIGRPYEALAPALSNGASQWLPGMVQSVYEAGEALRATVTVGNGIPLSKDVLVRVAQSQPGADHVVVPIRVTAAGPSSLFPRLEADVELAAVGADLSQLTLRGSYKPPLGAVGALIDRALLHRVAEAAVKDLVDQIARRLDATPVMAGAQPT
jgi:carbon monoxide dehydrogenase subunit G